MELNILLVEDDTDLMNQLKRDLPVFFKDNGIDSVIHDFDDFDLAIASVKSSHIRYDMVISDTYKGDHKNKDAAVLSTLAEYRNNKFCSVIVSSSGERPENLQLSPFVLWADKADTGSLERNILQLLELGIPQTAQKLHRDIESAASEYLWEFLEKNWDEIKSSNSTDGDTLERLIRRRASILINDVKDGEYVAVESKYGFEYYIYPAFKHAHFSLGDIIRNKQNPSQMKVIMTPHCHLALQSGQEVPRAEYVLVLNVELAEKVLGDKITNLDGKTDDDIFKRLRSWANSPAQTGKKPAGRHWYLPKFLEIPHLFVDFMQANSIEYSNLTGEYERIATLSPPYAEALQNCFSSFYSSIGIPRVEPKSILDLVKN